MILFFLPDFSDDTVNFGVNNKEEDFGWLEWAASISQSPYGFHLKSVPNLQSDAFSNLSVIRCPSGKDGA